MSNHRDSYMKFILLNQMLGTIKKHLAVQMIAGLLFFCGKALAATITNSTGLSITLDTTGNYTVQSAASAWTFSGSLGAIPTGVATNPGTDNIGVYSEIAFNYISGASHSA